MVQANIPIVAIVGGFLGAGKTTLILKAMEMLRQRGKRAAVILNDQDGGLVDTRHALARGARAREVADGCFCCRFSDFAEKAMELAAAHPDAIFAEPVGSCIDLSATVIRPLQEIYGDRLRVAPFTVLIDPAAARSLGSDGIDAGVRYLFTQQLAEADLVCTTKQDLHPEPAELFVPVDLHLSGKTGDGVEQWLKEIFEPSRVVGARLLDVDYTRYAEAEAALGWLNLHASVALASPRSPALLCGPLLDGLEKRLTGAGILIAHLKVFDRTPGGWVKASVCANGAEPVPEGDLLADAAGHHEIALNLRAVGEPEHLRTLVLAAFEAIPGSVQLRHLGVFRPPAPKPEYSRR